MVLEMKMLVLLKRLLLKLFTNLKNYNMQNILEKYRLTEDEIEIMDTVVEVIDKVSDEDFSKAFMKKWYGQMLMKYMATSKDQVSKQKIKDKLKKTKDYSFYEQKKRYELKVKKAEAINSQETIDEHDEFVIVSNKTLYSPLHDSYDQQIVLWFPYEDDLGRYKKMKFAWTMTVLKSQCPNLFVECLKNYPKH